MFSYIPKTLGKAKCHHSSILRHTNRWVSARGVANSAKPKRPSLKELMQTYGYSALGIYLGLSMIDLPICFFAVHSLGEEKIKIYMNRVKNVIGFGKEEQVLVEELMRKAEIEKQTEDSSHKDSKPSLWTTMKESTLLTEFLIAYGLHKSLIFIRLPITAAITPSTVKLLQKWGFNIAGLNKNLKTAGETAKVKYKSGDPSDFVKGSQIPRQHQTKGRKWFDGLM
ncbi:LAMI_0H13894g1_1 [Lachancea mirantina]|uniref:LAMI_0H13894g1_1 n=1 Tax=Lachancea mirantina TaxID=1230905 RepID=A0A1G4KHX3_9SACH|nr:LAMI_0H13894g1_1 [Lachancea mirantina]